MFPAKSNPITVLSPDYYTMKTCVDYISWGPLERIAREAVFSNPQSMSSGLDMALWPAAVVSSNQIPSMCTHIDP
jgi:hypothetical protein